METVVSGIRSTGNLHIGNYFGALKNFVKMQSLTKPENTSLRYTDPGR